MGTLSVSLRTQPWTYTRTPTPITTTVSGSALLAPHNATTTLDRPSATDIRTDRPPPPWKSPTTANSFSDHILVLAVSGTFGRQCLAQKAPTVTLSVSGTSLQARSTTPLPSTGARITISNTFCS